MKVKWGQWQCKEACKAVALQFKTLKEFKKTYPGAYDSCVRNKWLDELCSHMISIKGVFDGHWTFERCKEEAEKYGGKSKWRKNSPSSYQTAVRNKWLDLCHKNIVITRKHNGYWNLENCKASAKKFATKKLWLVSEPSAYNKAKKNNWLDECCQHMPKNSVQSLAEKEILKYVQLKFPLASNKWFGSKIKGRIGTMFELDIYIPELNRGIEFNGNYWHGIGFNRKGYESSEDYHNKKKIFFSKMGIHYLEIWENDWNKNKIDCLCIINDFLEQK